MSLAYMRVTWVSCACKYEAGGGFCQEKSATRAFGRFKGTTAIATGAAGNFGSCCARRFASEGASVACFDLKPADDLVAELSAAYPEAKFASYTLDVTDVPTVEGAVSDVVKDFGRIDYLFNNAGYQGDFAMAQDYKIPDFQRVIDINVVGMFAVLKTVANACTRHARQEAIT